MTSVCARRGLAGRCVVRKLCQHHLFPCFFVHLSC